MEAVMLFGSFLLLIFIRVPIGYAIGIGTMITLMIFSDIPLIMITQNAVAGVDSFPLMAIPFFILAGNIMSTGGVAKRLVDLASLLVGKITGGLAMVTTVVCMFFAAISGSAMATTSAVGAFMIPEMEKKGYDRGFGASIAAAAGTIGVIIPPSIPFVLYGVVTGTSIGDLFKAGFLPGIAMGAGLMITCYFISKKEGYRGTDKKVSSKELWYTFKDAIWAILSPGIILGGIYSGIFTPTEAAVVSVVYSAIIGAFVYKELTWQKLYDALRDTIVVNGLTTFMVGLSAAFAAYLSMQQIPTMIAGSILSVTSNPILLLLIINMFLLVVGCVIDNIPATIILAPILLPIVTKLGMSPAQFGVVLTMNLAIGFTTPPYGIDLFVASAIADVSIERMMKTMKWLIFSLLVVLLLTTYFKPLTMFLVNVLK
nr:TRAP transporter large permease [Sedimentibacter sp.]